MDEIPKPWLAQHLASFVKQYEAGQCSIRVALWPRFPGAHRAPAALDEPVDAMIVSRVQYRHGKRLLDTPF